MSRPSALRRAATTLVAVTALLATALSVAPATAAVPGAPTGLSASDEGPTPTLGWNRVAKATGYVVEAYRGSDSGGTKIFSVPTANASYVHTKRLPTGDVYWRVRAQNADGLSEWSDSLLTVRTSGVLEPVSPINGEEVTPPIDPPVLRWKVVSGAVGYEVQVATNDTFTSPQSFKTKSTAFVVPNPQVVGRYFWRFRADFGNGMLSDWSFPADYQVAALPLIEGDDVSSPPTGTAVQDVVMEWAPVRGAQSYQLQVATDRSFNTIIDDQKRIYSTRYSPSTTYPNNDYFWRVRAVNSAGEPTGWAVTPIEFQRRWPARPSLLHPADRVSPATADPVFFEWTPVPHAQRYRLEIGTDPNFSPGSYEFCYTASTTYTPGYIVPRDRCAPGSQGRTYYWRVLAVEPSTGAEVPSIYSPIHSFIYDSGPVVKTAPAAGATVDVPTLRWEAQRDAERYRVTVKDRTGGVVASTETYATSWTPRKAALDPADSPFTWSVVAIDQADDSTSPNYGSRSFNVTGDQPDDPAVSPLTPDEPAPSTRFPALTWEPMPGAAYYRITVGVEGTGYSLDPSTTPMLRNTFAYSSLTDESDYFLAPNTYRWRITAFNDDGGSMGTGPASTFTVTELESAAGQRIGLTGLATSGGSATSCGKRLSDAGAICLGVPSTPVLKWDPVPGAGSYMVYLAEDRDLTQLVYGDSAQNKGIPTTKNTVWTPPSTLSPSALPDNESGEAYFWYIRPCKADGKCGPDPLNTDDAATHAFRKLSPQVKQVTPAVNATVGHQVTFTWEDYLETNEGVALPGSPDSPSSHLTADRYRIQVFTSSAGGQPIDDQVVDQTTYTPWRTTYPEGDLWWRVQAIDAAGNGLAWSPMRPLRHQTPYANLHPLESLDTGTEGPLDTDIEPAHNQSVAGDTVLSWTARHYDASWNVEIYRNDDTTGSPANLVVKSSTQQAAFTWTSQLPAAESAYRWRIQRRDATGKLGPWSDWGRFFVADTDVTLLQPGEGYVPADGAVFAWDAVQDGADPVRAATYKLTVSSDDGGSGFTTTTAATRWAEPRRLRTGTYSWSVQALNGTGDVIGVSPRRTFRVDDTAPTIVSQKPSSSAKRKANVVVTFSEPVTNVTSRTLQLYVKGRGMALRAKVTVSADGRTATLNPAALLARRKTHTVRVRPTIRDRAGLPVAKTSWTFVVR